MRKMIVNCKAFANDFRVTCNCDKTKFIGTPVIIKDLRAVFIIDVKRIENIDKWSHLGQLLNVNCNDNEDIQARINCSDGQVNSMFFL